MKYYCTNSTKKGTCYHEFQKGKFEGSFWHEDSLLLHDDILIHLNLKNLFMSIIPHYNSYNETEVTPNDWKEIYIKACEIGGETKVVIEELNSWAEATFISHGLFTILGI